MLMHQGVYLPDGERHLVEWMDAAGEIVDGKGTYLIDKYRAAIASCTSFRTAIDVGAHCGMWSMQAAKEFRAVDAFEPIAEHLECWHQNMHGVTNAAVYPYALGAHEGTVSMERAAISSAESWVSGAGNEIRIRTLDSFGRSDVSLIKLHCVGSELPVLLGAKETIAKWHPVIAFEEKPGRGARLGLSDTGAREYLESIGYAVKTSIRGDHIMTYRGRQ